MKYGLVRGIMLAALLMLSFFPGCTQPRTREIGFHPQLSISDPPELGKVVKVTLTFTSVVPKGLEGKELYYLGSIELTPTVYQVIDGDLLTKGRIVPGETHTLEATIKSVRTSGSAQIYGRVALHYSPDDTGTSGDWDRLFIAIASDGATVSRNPLNTGIDCS